MQIDVTKIRDWFPGRGVDLTEAWGIVGRFYCRPMTANGLCTRECLNCKPHLDRMFDLSNARNKAAYLTTVAKDAFARQQEVKSVSLPNTYVTVSDVENPFLELMGQL